MINHYKNTFIYKYPDAIYIFEYEINGYKEKKIQPKKRHNRVT